ncbi:unannotated protein [freshwater metagenome]|uniref:Unannotated protein n=1 Tax=freshwater metagenome TaxID=449393 RepID=A0A6J6JLE5_9ZZZZ
MSPIANPGNNLPPSPPKARERSENDARRPSVASRNCPGSCHRVSPGSTKSNQLSLSHESALINWAWSTTCEPSAWRASPRSPMIRTGTGPRAKVSPASASRLPGALLSPGMNVPVSLTVAATFSPSRATSMAWSRVALPTATTPTITVATSSAGTTVSSQLAGVIRERTRIRSDNPTPTRTSQADGRVHVPRAQASHPAPASGSMRKSRRVLTGRPERETLRALRDQSQKQPARHQHS